MTGSERRHSPDSVLDQMEFALRGMSEAVDELRSLVNELRQPIDQEQNADGSE